MAGTQNVGLSAFHFNSLLLINLELTTIIVMGGIHNVNCMRWPLYGPG